MKYNVGDRVRIKSLDWYNENKNHCGEIPLFKPRGLFVPDMSRYCNNIMTIKDICYGTCYRMKEDFWNYNWTDEMIECKVEEEVGLVDNLSSRWANEFTLPDGYQFTDENGNVINATKIVLEKKKEYPKTYEECAEIIAELTGSDCNPKGCMGYMSVQLTALQKLLICRDAYWKLYGEEMGLGKPWAPDWDTSEPKYVIACTNNGVEKQWETTYCKKFAFPTEKIRDTFRENFDLDIEICKEFL